MAEIRVCIDCGSIPTETNKNEDYCPQCEKIYPKTTLISFVEKSFGRKAHLINQGHNYPLDFIVENKEYSFVVNAKSQFHAFELVIEHLFEFNLYSKYDNDFLYTLIG